MEDPPAPFPRSFATTRWSLVAAARPGASSESRARRALEALCVAYWYPLYAYVRRRGYGAAEAQDLTQSFFTRILETDGLATADPERGRFRSYLLGAMKHFLANEWHRAQAAKRGGGVVHIRLDALDPAARYDLEPAAGEDPDAAFDRAWALETSRRAMDRLRAEWASRGRGDVFEGLSGCLAGAEPPRSEMAAGLGMSAGAVKTAVHRLRKRYGELLRAEIAETVRNAEDIDDELRHLVTALRRVRGDCL